VQIIRDRTTPGHDDLLGLLDDALVAEPPLLPRDGGFIAPSYDDELDEARTLRDEGRGVIAAMQAEFIELSGITSLKIKHNNVLGYFIETTATHAEKMLAAPLNETFIHRQTTANQVRFNMAGKSTFLRQNALIGILAQMGSYVPAKSAHIGVISQIFSRVGASDDLAKGRSTFMVEMVETAAILNWR